MSLWTSQTSDIVHRVYINVPDITPKRTNMYSMYVAQNLLSFKVFKQSRYNVQYAMKLEKKRDRKFN